MRQFYWMWLGQLVSILASGVTNFALGIWILKQSNEVMDYATLMVAASLPGILLTPFIGALIDRYSRKKVIILADLGAACTTLMVALLYFSGELSIWQIYIAAAIDSVALAFHLPAMTALVTKLVAKDQLGKAAGMNELSAALAVIAGPFFAGILIQSIGIAGILLLDMLSFMVAATILISMTIPSDKGVEKKKGANLIREAKEGWYYIYQKKGFTRLLIFGALINAIGGMVIALMMPMALRLGDETRVGFILAAGGLGSLLGGIALAITGGPARKIHGLIGGTLAAGVFLFLLGLQSNIWLVAMSLCLFNACIPIAFGSELVIWQRKVDEHVQGRVFSVYTAVSSITIPLGSFIAGYCADALKHSTLLSWVDQGVLSNFIRVNNEISFLFLVMSVVVVLIAIWGRSQSAIWNIEEQLLDASPSDTQERLEVTSLSALK